MMLSPHFSLAELTVTKHTDIDNTPTLDAQANLVKLSMLLLEPVRAQFGAVHVSSGYRSPALNSRVGGAKTSAHRSGCAADFHVDTATVADVVEWIRHSSGLQYDQVIDEYDGESHWCHLGMLRPGYTVPRNQAWMFRHGVYSPLA